MKLRAPVLVSLLSFGLGAVACDSKMKECNEVAGIVNSNIEEVHKIDQQMHAVTDPAEEAKQSKAMIATVDQAATKLGALELKTEGLAPLVQAYTGMLEDIQAGSKEIIAQTEAAGEVSEEKIAESFKALADAQAGLAKACESGAEDCVRVSAIMEKFPDEPSEEQLVKAFADLSSELEKLEIEDAAVKTATDSFIEVSKAKSALLDKALKLQAAVNAGVKKIEAAVEREDKVVDDLNEFCGAT